MQLIYRFFTTSEHQFSIVDNVSFGAGLGIPYGVVSANINYQINETFDVFLGAGLGFGTDVKFHPFESNREFRLTAYSGTNAIILEPTTDEIERFSGLNLGIDYGSISDSRDFDLLFIPDIEDLEDRINGLEA